MMDLSKVRNYYVACGYTDLRLGIDGLASVVTQQYGGHMNEESPQIAITSWTPCDKTLVTDGSAGSIRERGCRSRQAA